jgi:iron(III) transport system permease protein
MAGRTIAWPARAGWFPRAEPGVLAVHALGLAALALFVVYPALAVLRYPGLSDYLAILHDPRWIAATGHSAVITLLSTASSTLVGLGFAFAATRHDIPCRRIFRLMGTLPLFAPPFMVAFAAILMFGRQGLISRHLLGLNVDIFGLPGLWLSQTIAFFPLAALVIQGVLDGIHPTAEQAALTLGANGSRALATVTLPLALPGIVGATLVVAITVLADFGNAVVIAGNYPLLATEAWFHLEGLADLNGAAVVVAVLLVPTVLLFIASRRIGAKRGYATVTGRGAAMEQIATPLWLRATVVTLCGSVSLLVALVYVGILLAGLVNLWGRDWSPTLRHWRDALGHLDALGNSLTIGAAAGLLTALLGQIAAFVRSRDVPFRRTLDFLAVLPGALPGVFIGVGFVLAFNAPPLALGGTSAIIVLALGFWHLPLAYQATTAALGQIHRSIEDAARNLGASELRLVRDVYAPLLARSLVASFLQSFIRSVSNISIVVFLVAPGNVVVTYVILQMIGGADWSGAAALTSLLLVVTFVCVGLSRLCAGRMAVIARGGYG